MSAIAETAVRERPILFSGPMVRAILDGRKTQTRRVMQHQPFSNTIRFNKATGDIDCYNDYLPPSATLLDVGRGRNRYTTSLEEEGGSFARLCPYGQPGDRLWIRETFSVDQDWDNAVFFRADDSAYRVGYRDDDELHLSNDERTRKRRPKRWKPAIHMPRWASRLTLEITGVRVQRVQEISTLDIRAEGISIENNGYTRPGEFHSGARAEFEDLWNSLNAKRGHGWDANPWVWVLAFKLLQQESGQ